MPRTVEPEEWEAKRDKILDATQQLVVTKGYERMTIQDILAELRMSSGAFHHHFDAKPEVLDAPVERIEEESGAPLLAHRPRPEPIGGREAARLLPVARPDAGRA